MKYRKQKRLCANNVRARQTMPMRCLMFNEQNTKYNDCERLSIAAQRYIYGNL